MSKLFYPQARAVLQVIFDGHGGEDTAPKIIPVLPKEVSIHRNSYNQADGWEMTFDALDFPVDPQLVRAGSAEIYLFHTQSLPAADQRIQGRQFGADVERSAALRPTDSKNTAALEQNLPRGKDAFTFGNKPAIAGLFDEHSVSLSSSGRWVTISGQDYTAYLIGRHWVTQSNGRSRRIPTGQRLDRVLIRLLREADPGGNLSLRVVGLEASDLPNVGANETRGHKRGIPVESETSYWDIMYKMAVRHGMILFVRGLEVILTKPQNLADEYDPNIKRLAWGKNIESLEMQRRMGKEKVPRIRVVAYDTSGRQTAAVEYPKTRSAVPVGTIGTNPDEFEVVPIYGITDRGVLEDIAKTTFYLRGRGERTVNITTRDLTDLGTDTRQAADMLDLNAGDAVRIDFLEFNLNHALLEDESLPTETKVQHLVSRGYNTEIASIIAERYEKLKFLQRPLRVKEVSYEYSASDGISIEMELVDFIVIDGIRERADKVSRNSKRERAYSKANRGSR